MAVCAIVSARRNNTAGGFSNPTVPSKAYYRAALAAFPSNLSEAKGFDYRRAKVLLAIACIQYGAILDHQTQLGEYVVLACNEGFQDENRWEQSLNEIQRQERRRLVSSILHWV